MSVETVYQGRFGNHVFQYACARLFAIERGLKMETEFCETDILPVSPHEEGEFYKAPLIGVGDGTDVFSLPKKEARYRFHGFFQRSDFYFKRRAALEKIFRPRPTPVVDTGNDILMSLRLGDYFQHQIAIHYSWYIKILERESFDRLIIISDDPNPDYLKHFERWDPIVVPGSASKHWDLIRAYERVIASNSTFCWWALFFGRAKKIYIFKRWIGHPHSNLNEFEGAIQVDGPFLHEGSI